MKDDRFVEGTTRKVDLPDDSPDVFQAFEYYIYNECLLFKNGKEDNLLPHDEVIEQMSLCARIWTFGDKILMPDLQDHAITRVCWLLGGHEEEDRLPLAGLAGCYLDAPDGSPVRKCITDHLVSLLESSDLSSEEQELAAIPGIFNALHDSEKALRDLPKGDFPRYWKIKKFRSILSARTDFGKDPVPANGSTSSEWNKPDEQEYIECGFRSTKMWARCIECKSMVWCPPCNSMPMEMELFCGPGCYKDATEFT